MPKGFRRSMNRCLNADNVDQHGTREVAQAFVDFLFTPEAQREFAKVDPLTPRWQKK